MKTITPLPCVIALAVVAMQSCVLGDRPTPDESFRAAIHSDDMELARRSLENARASDLLGMLIDAAEAGKIDFVVAAVNKGAPLDTLYEGRISPIYAACLGDAKAPFIKQLVKLGANVDQGMSEGFWPVGYCAMNGKSDLLAVLLDCGADLSGRKKNDKVNALMYACQSGHIECVRLLLRKGANPKEVDKAGRNAYDYLRLENVIDFRVGGEVVETHVAILSEETIEIISKLLDGKGEDMDKMNPRANQQ